MNPFTYHIINRAGEILLSQDEISYVSENGFALTKNQDQYYLFEAGKGLRPLPSRINNLYTHYDTNMLQDDIFVGYQLAPKRSIFKLWQQRSLDYDSKYGHIVASFAINKHLELLFEPIPLFLQSFHNGESLALDKRKNIYRVNNQGKIIFTYPKEWRLLGYHLYQKKIKELRLCKKSQYMKDDALEYLCDVNMEWVKGPFKSVFKLQEGVRRIVNMNDHESYVDENWNECFQIPSLCSSLGCLCNHGHLEFYSSKNNKYGLININGEIVIKPKYSNIIHLDGPLWWYKKRGYYGILHESGEELSEPLFNVFVDSQLYNGLICVNKKGDSNKDSGYINLQAEWVIKPQFSAGSRFYHQEYATVRTYSKAYEKKQKESIRNLADSLMSRVPDIKACNEEELKYISNNINKITNDIIDKFEEDNIQSAKPLNPNDFDE